MGNKKTLATLLSALLIGAGMFTLISPAEATEPDPVHKVTICHRTNSITNPYVVITVDEAAVNMDTGDDNGLGDHNAEHNGPVFDAANPPPPPHNGDQWGDIIPPFYEDGTPGTWPAKNFGAVGQAFFEAGCMIPSPTTTSTTGSTTSTTEGTTTSSTGSTSTSSSSTSSSSTTSTTEGSTTTEDTTTTTDGITTTTECVGEDCPVITPFAFGAAGTECQAEVPVIVITFANTFPELAGQTGTLFIDTITEEPVGEVAVTYQPGETVEILYPGAEVDENGNIIDLPGWTLQDNGLWVIDESDAFLRDGLLLRYELADEVAFAEVTYPPESSLCANPPPPGTPTTTTSSVPGSTPPLVVQPPGTFPPGTPGSPGSPSGSLPQTGTDLALSTVGGFGLLTSGLLVLLARRRMDGHLPQHLL